MIHTPCFVEQRMIGMMEGHFHSSFLEKIQMLFFRKKYNKYMDFKNKKTSEYYSEKSRKRKIFSQKSLKIFETEKPYKRKNRLSTKILPNTK